MPAHVTDEPTKLGNARAPRSDGRSGIGVLGAGMSLEQLESFVAVAEEGAVVHAARRLHLTQPPLSRRIQSLEDELGVPLFQRAARGMRLTPAGERLLPHARLILAAVAQVRAVTGEVARGTPDIS